ncbi:hypothetical protein RBSWK_02684 [Rhodopirellula baltica SWK14]|uniref:Uncharacterized protein n=1 Tax=Rhodopirellula baltica SWK14 TaxID=993516 RepID=L7CGJ3_RHOBT|nr:hypothetical protein RBSWK_02684 [Rhodopirellula baltica SWK14]
MEQTTHPYAHPVVDEATNPSATTRRLVHYQFSRIDHLATYTPPTQDQS